MKILGRDTPTDFQVGKTLVYFKKGVLEELEVIKSEFFYQEATAIQKIVLGFNDDITTD